MCCCGCSVLLDNFWDEAFEPTFQSQVVPDAIELDLSDVAAGLQQHIHADCLPEHWTPCPECSAEFGDILRQPSSSAHALSSVDEVDEAVDSFAAALFGRQDLHSGKAAAAAAAHHPLPADPSQQQQQVPDTQWVPTPLQQPAAAVGFTWPCPDELRKPLNASNLTAAHMVPMVFPATPAAAAPAAVASVDSSCFSFDLEAKAAAAPPAASLFAAMPAPAALKQCSRYTAAADSAGSGTAAEASAAAAAVEPGRFRHVLDAAAAADWAQQLGPAVRSRAEAVARYKAKRARRSTVKRVRYQRRKDYADKRPRVGGRFVKLTDLQQQ
jgi:hypothetical protein